MTVGMSVGSARLGAAGTDVVWLPRFPRTGNPAVILVHGLAGDAASAYDSLAGPTMQRLVAAGYAVYSHDFGGGTTWGTTAATTPMLSVVNAVKARGHGQVHLVGLSMGAWNCLSFLRLNPGAADSAALLAPTVNGRQLLEGALAGAINAAWGGSLPANQDPMFYGSQVVAETPTGVWMSGDDTTAPPDGVAAFCRTTGITPRSLGAVGHSLGSRPNELALELIAFMGAAAAAE